MLGYLGNVDMLVECFKVQIMTDYPRGTGVSEYPPIIGCADNQI